MKKLKYVLTPLLFAFIQLVLYGCSTDSSVNSASPFQHQSQITVEVVAQDSIDTSYMYRVKIIAKQLDTIESIWINADTSEYYEPARGNSVNINIPADNPSEITVDLFRSGVLVLTGSFSAAAGLADTVINLAMQSASPPSTPAGVSATSNGSSVSLSWDAVDGADVYFVYRSTDTSSGYELLKKSWRTSTTDGSVSSGNNYFYRISAVSIAGESSPTEWIEVEI
ncbi:MAG TPA: hypothetical protein DCO75_02215 [Fibrobacteres bacterium]|nr:hypothetical protein [Fibrobacterota bacterium]